MGEDDYSKYDTKEKPKAKKQEKKSEPKQKKAEKKEKNNVLEEVDEDAVPSFITQAAEQMTGTAEEEKTEKKKEHKDKKEKKK